MLNTAIQNNIDWCVKVCETHGVGETRIKNVWAAVSKAPPYYPDIITSNRNATAEEVMEFIDGRQIRSIKDSFAKIDMSAYGFQILFEAEWIYYPPGKGNTNVSSPWQVIRLQKEFDVWTQASGLTDVIRPELLKRKDVKFFIRRIGDKYAGFSASSGYGVVGISNVFSEADMNGELWLEIRRAASREFPGLPLVGYERDEHLQAALAARWISVGTLLIWHMRLFS